MKPNLMKDIFGLAFIKKNFFERLAYLFMGIIFFLFLVNEKKLRKEKNHGAADASLAGDDVYPLF